MSGDGLLATAALQRTTKPFGEFQPYKAEITIPPTIAEATPALESG